LRVLVRAESETPDAEAVDPIIFAEPCARYTMEDARGVHDKVFGTSFDAVAPPVAATEAEKNLDDLFL